MSFLARTPICPRSINTDLASALDRHEAVYRGDRAHSLSEYGREWLNVLRDRAVTQQDVLLKSLTTSMLTLLANPTSSTSFKDIFKSLYEQAMKHAYPVALALSTDRIALSRQSLDYTLQCIDLGQVRMLEDAALSDPTIAEFVKEMRRVLSTPMSVAREEVYRGLFDIYSEAIVYRLLKERCGAQLKIQKIKEVGTPTPDFECRLACQINGEQQELVFYVEVKSLDIVHAPQRLPEMREAAMDAQIDLEEQRRSGKAIPMIEHEIAPYQPYTSNDKYDPRSVRRVIETLIDKAKNNFKASQFKLGPTFALANILRLPLLGQGVNALAPFFYDSLSGGACVSGILWHVVFGECGSPVHRSPDFEGAGTFDGNLQKAGILIESALMPLAPGVITLYYDNGEYRFNGLYDSRWKDNVHCWTDIESQIVLDALCGDFNSKDNSMAHKYAMRRI